MAPLILTINSGSSSVKFALFEASQAGQPVLLARGALDDHAAHPGMRVVDAQGAVLEERRLDSSGEGVFEALLAWIEAQPAHARLAAIGHRIVHGGSAFRQPVLVDAAQFQALEALTPLAPLHQPRCLQPLRALQSLRPDLPQIACFDTAFHHTLQPPVSRYALPRHYEDEGIRKYGFHGLSYEFIAGRLKELSPELFAARTVVAHLGNGASLCAMRDGRSVDTTMGFTALDGLVMGSRCGMLDPGVLIYLQKKHGLSAEALEDVLYRRSGLLGVSQISSDMRVLRESSDPRAREAIDLFTFRAAQAVAMMANSLAGLDCLVFTGGIGEHAQIIRAGICERLQWLGVALDPQLNEANRECVSRSGSAVKILVVPTDEEVVIARHVGRLLGIS